MTAGRDDDPRDSGERPKKSWREIDASRDRSRSPEPSERRPSSAAAQARATAATQQYVRSLDASLFSKQKGGAGAERLARAMQDALGTPGFNAACQAYREACGVPEDPSLLSLFLDATDSGLLVEVLDALAARGQAGPMASSSGLRTRLRLLAQSPDDAVAERAEDLLAAL